MTARAGRARGVNLGMVEPLTRDQVEAAFRVIAKYGAGFAEAPEALGLADYTPAPTPNVRTVPSSTLRPRRGGTTTPAGRDPSPLARDRGACSRCGIIRQINHHRLVNEYCQDCKWVMRAETAEAAS